MALMQALIQFAVGLRNRSRCLNGMGQSFFFAYVYVFLMRFDYRSAPELSGIVLHTMPVTAKKYCVNGTRYSHSRGDKGPVSHAIMSSMQYYLDDIIACAIMSAGHICIFAKPSLQ